MGEKNRKINKKNWNISSKAKSIFNLSKILIEKHKGKVPKTYDELEKLPGVGHKTASVVMSQGFGFPAFPVDTHIHRLAQRWGLTDGKSVVKTEKDLKVFSKKNTGTNSICKSFGMEENFAKLEIVMEYLVKFAKMLSK